MRRWEDGLFVKRVCFFFENVHKKKFFGEVFLFEEGVFFSFEDGVLLFLKTVIFFKRVFFFKKVIFFEKVFF